MTWTEKYRPKYFLEIKGQEEAINVLRKFIDDFYKNTPRSKKAIILHGPPGIGKTTLAHVIAIETNSEIFELNASDLRNKDKLKAILKPAIEQRSLTKNNKIILVDEVDGISGADRGGITELLYLIGSTNHPMIITANDVWKKKLSPLRKKAEMVQLKEINYNISKDVMIGILKKENLFVDNDILTKIALNSKGDLRAAINDLQIISKMKVPSKEIDERNKETDIFNALRLIFKGKPTEDTLKIFDSVNLPLDDIFLWIEENIPLEYSGKELERAYDLLSKADVFRGRIYKQQYWRFLVYENAFLSYGIASSKKGIKTGFTNYKRPSRILKIWIHNQRSAKKKTIAIKYARYVHIGQKRAMKDFPIIKQILKNHSIRKEIRLSSEEIEYLDKPVY